MGCLYIILPLQLQKIGILYIGVGLSALLVSTIRAMREPLDRGSSDSSAPRFSYMDVIFNCPARSLLVKRHFMLDNNRFTLLRDNIHIDKYVDINKPISRYTSFSNLLLILSHKEFFVQAKKHFSDKIESFEEYVPFSSDFSVAGKELSESQIEEGNLMRKECSETKNWFTSCWTMNIEESFLMWKSYAPDLFSVKIDTTIAKVLDGLDISEYKTYAANIHYRNRRTIINSTTDYAFFKYNYYKDENEFRFYFIPLTQQSEEKNSADYTYLKIIDPNKMISKITLSPFLNIKTYSLLEDLLIDKFNLDKGKIEKSRIPIKTKQ